MLLFKISSKADAAIRRFMWVLYQDQQYIQYMTLWKNLTFFEKWAVNYYKN